MLREIPKSEVLKAIVNGGQVYSVCLDADSGSAPLDLTADIKDMIDGEKSSRFLLDVAEDAPAVVLPEPDKKESAEASPPVKKKQAKSVGQRRIDSGKIMALHNAGWNNAKIAEEMRISPTTVTNYLKRMENANQKEKQ